MRSSSASKRSAFFLCLAFIVLCAVVSAQQKNENRQRPLELKVLTYNICGLPDYITSERNLITPAKKRLRLIGDLIKGYDIIGLQEVFIPDRYIIERKLRNHFVARGTDSPKANPTGSGIYIFSKGEIRKSIYERWNKLYDFDAFSEKGFVGAVTTLPGSLDIDVYNLHGQASAGSEARIANYKQLLNAVARFSKGSGRPILILGDFNCAIGEVECTWLLEHSNLKHANPALVDVDNIFYSENGSGWKITVVSAKYVFNEKVNGKRISDHFGLEAVFRFER